MNDSALPQREKLRESHQRGGEVIKDVVYAAHDGIVTTFAVVAGITGAALSPVAVIIIGIASLFADGLSMAFGNYLGTVSEQRFIASERRREEREVEEIPDAEREEIRDIYRAKGFEGELLETVVARITADKARWVDVMMQEELELSLPENLHPVRNGLLTFFSFVAAGAVPLAAFFPFWNLGAHAFVVAIALTGAALFGVGAARSFVTRTNPVVDGMEMLGVGAMAAAVAYGIGAFLGNILRNGSV